MRYARALGISAALLLAAIGLHGQGFGFGSSGGAGRIATVSVTEDTAAAGIETWQLAGVRAKDGSVTTRVVYGNTETGALMRGRATDSTLNPPLEGCWSGPGVWCGKACTWKLSAALQLSPPSNGPPPLVIPIKFGFVAKAGAEVLCKRDATITDSRCLVVVMP